MKPILAALVVFGQLASCDLPPDDYLVSKEKGKELKSPLSLREEQGGVAGTTIHVWEIQPDGKWSYVTFLKRRGDVVSDTKNQVDGSLSQPELIQLAKTLGEQRLNSLPETLGEKSKVNPHSYTITFGDRKTTLHLLEARRQDDVKQNILNSSKADSNTQSFASVAGAITGVTTAKK